MSFFSFNQCANGPSCAHFPEKGRPAYLIDADARRTGLCKPCRDRTAVESSDHGKIQQIGPAPLAGESFVSANEILGAEMKVVTMDGRLREFLSGDERYYDNEQYTDAAGFEARQKKALLVDSEPLDFNVDMKRGFLSGLPKEMLAIMSDATTRIIPSKDSPQAAAVGRVDLRNNPGLVEDEQMFAMAYEAANFPMNDHKLAKVWAAGWRFKPLMHSFFSEAMRKEKGVTDLGDAYDKAPKLWDYNCSALVSKEDVKAIFGDIDPDQLNYYASIICGLWDGVPAAKVSDKPGAYAAALGGDRLPEDIRGSAAHYAMAIGSALESLHDVSNTQGNPSPDGPRFFERYLSTHLLLADKFKDDVYPSRHPHLASGFKDEREAVAWLMSNPREVDDFLWDGRALDYVNAERNLEYARKLYGTKSLPPDQLEKLKDVQKRVLAFTDLIDRRWKEKYEAAPVKALAERFGHPVGVPTDKVRPWHFAPGGYLVEGGWLDIGKGDGKSPVLDVKFPVDKNGRPSPDSSDWDSVKGKARIRDMSTLSGLGDLAEACASGHEAWHVAYNLGLPRDSLYTGALISNTASFDNGSSMDDYSGSVRGLYHTWKFAGIEMNFSKEFLCYPTARAKITAIRRGLADARILPRGAISQSEIDLSNWRIARLADNMCGNEYGVNSVKDGAKEPYNFSRLGREYHEEIQKSVRGLSVADGLATFPTDDDMVRPLVGVQRGETMRLFMESPGTFLRRTPFGGSIAGGPATAVLNQVTNPVSPPSAFTDFATGNVGSGAVTATGTPGTLSLYPLHFVAPASGSVNYGEGHKNHRAENFNKLVSFGAGRRDENFPRRLRFAFRSLGEKATQAGLIDPGVDTSKESKQLLPIQNPHGVVAEAALITLDTPAYAEETKSAPWQTPDLFAKDYELGEMGQTFKKLAKREPERRKVLQALLAGKQAMRQELTNSARKVLAATMAHFRPADPRLFFGRLNATGEAQPRPGDESVQSKTIGPNGRNGGIQRKLMIFGRPQGIFFARRHDEKKDPKRLEPFYRSGSKIIPSSSEFFCVKGGYTTTGLEDTPVFYDASTPPSKWGQFVDRWHGMVHQKGLAGEYEPYDHEGMIQKVGSRYKSLTDHWRKATGDVNAHLVPDVVAKAAFASPSRMSGNKELFDDTLDLAAMDEGVMRAYRGDEERMRPEYAESLKRYDRSQLDPLTRAKTFLGKAGKWAMDFVVFQKVGREKRRG